MGKLRRCPASPWPRPSASTAAVLVAPVSGAADQLGDLEKPVADSALLVNADRDSPAASGAWLDGPYLLKVRFGSIEW